MRTSTTSKTPPKKSTPTTGVMPKIGRPHKNPADRPAAIALRERFLDWRDEKKDRR